MKIIDAFIFYNEEKMLDFRLKYYSNIVDYFVIVESTITFSGVHKPLYFEKLKEKYAHLNIIHYVVKLTIAVYRNKIIFILIIHYFIN